MRITLFGPLKPYRMAIRLADGVGADAGNRNRIGAHEPALESAEDLFLVEKLAAKPGSDNHALRSTLSGVRSSPL